ncbi:unnamed protein product [Rhizophagus irregularis]|uniref:Uncharacterized protein n=1 Tax=Rhizophagus irregularis TaxID=588596 RepID=A0A2I1H7L5_9GLOM|nr:hypothetical protein RhiirA4_502660 [Rhizophagus irregularis]CAB4441542.1 unnamed protein product [Rhizophagus irregularis]
MANTSANDPNSDDNSSDILDITVYFDEEVFKEEEGANQAIEKHSAEVNVSKNSGIIVIPAKADDYDDVYFDDEDLKEEVNEIKSDDETDSSDSEEERLDESDDDGYNGYGGYNEYGERDRGYYYRDGEYERKTSPMMSPIISPVTA